MGRLARVAASVAVWALVVACVGLLLAVGLGPRTGRYRTLTVLSGSMTPTIPIGSVVVVTPQRPDELQVGHIVTYQIPVDDHRVVTHRVVKILEAGRRPVFQTKGDANDSPDPWVAQVNGETMWRVRFTAPHAGFAVQWLRQPLVHKISVVVIPGVLAVWWILGIWSKDGHDEAAATGAQP